MGNNSSSDNSNTKDEILDLCPLPNVVDFKEEIIVINGSRRNVSTWANAKNSNYKALVMISHGLNEHSLCYYPIAQRLAQKGILVHGIDHVSHGKSDGRRGVIEDHRIIVSDFIEFVSIMRKKDNLNVPVFILAHSMGTLVALGALRQIPDITGMILSGAAIVAGPAAASLCGIRCFYPLSRTSFAACVTGVTATLNPAGPAAPIEVDEITSDKAAIKVMLKDKRRNPPMVKNKTARELLKLQIVVRQEIPKVKIPLLVIHGANDLIAMPEGSEYIYDLVATEKKDKALKIIKDARHECFHEVEAIANLSFEFVENFIENLLAASVPHANTDVTVYVDNNAL